METGIQRGKSTPLDRSGADATLYTVRGPPRGPDWKTFAESRLSRLDENIPCEISHYEAPSSVYISLLQD